MAIASHSGGQNRISSSATRGRLGSEMECHQLWSRHNADLEADPACQHVRVTDGRSPARRRVDAHLILRKHSGRRSDAYSRLIDGS